MLEGFRYLCGWWMQTDADNSGHISMFEFWESLRMFYRRAGNLEDAANNEASSVMYFIYHAVMVHFLAHNFFFCC